MSDAGSSDMPPADPTLQTGSTPPQGASGYGGLGKRLLARIIDYLIVAVPMGILLAVLPGIRVGGDLGNALTSLVAFGYFVFLETSQGATLGKKALSIAVTGDAGATVRVDASMRRNWWMLLGLLSGIPVIGWLAGLASLAIVILIAVTISSDPRNQGWHDKLGGTLVVDRGAT